jgi:hypothetical protein
MSVKSPLSFAVGVAVLFLAGAFGAWAQDSAPPVAAPANLAQAQAMALHATIALQALADKQVREGRPVGTLHRAFAIRAGLEDDQAAALGRVAARMKAQVAPLDERARTIIQTARQKYPGGRLPPGTVPPPPPPELAELQSQRDAIVQQAVKELQTELSPAGLAKLNDYLSSPVLRRKLSSRPVRTPAEIGPLGQTTLTGPSGREGAR